MKLVLFPCVWHDMGKDRKQPPNKCIEAGCSGFVRKPEDCPFKAFIHEPMTEPLVILKKEVN